MNNIINATNAEKIIHGDWLLICENIHSLTSINTVNFTK